MLAKAGGRDCEHTPTIITIQLFGVSRADDRPGKLVRFLGPNRLTYKFIKITVAPLFTLCSIVQ